MQPRFFIPILPRQAQTIRHLIHFHKRLPKPTIIRRPHHLPLRIGQPSWGPQMIGMITIHLTLNLSRQRRISTRFVQLILTAAWHTGLISHLS